MIVIKFTYPLQWPQHTARTPKWDKKIHQGFKSGMSINETLTFLQEELEALGAKQVVLNSDYENLANPRLQRRVGQETAAVLHFKLNDYSYSIACDRWLPIEQNIYTLHLLLRNIRATVECGIGTPNQLLAGFGNKATMDAAAAPHLPFGERRAVATIPALEEWRLQLGLGPTAVLDDAHAVYRRRAKQLATDPEALLQLNLAMEAATKALG